MEKHAGLEISLHRRAEETAAAAFCCQPDSAVDARLDLFARRAQAANPQAYVHSLSDSFF